MIERRPGKHNKGNGAGVKFLRDHVNDPDGECLIWPMYRNPNGYGNLGFEGKQFWAHRFMCELANGPPPSSDSEAAHSCGRGADGCVHPRHLSWKSASGNALDCRRHGTQVRSVHGVGGRLTKEAVAEIRALRGQMTQEAIAAKFKISPPTVRDIFHGRSHSRPSKVNLYSKDDEAALVAAFNRKLSVTEIASLLGRSEPAVLTKLSRLGLRRGAA